MKPNLTINRTASKRNLQVHPSLERPVTLDFGSLVQI